MDKIKVIQALYKISKEQEIRINTNDFFRKLTKNITYNDLIAGLNSEVEVEVEDKISDEDVEQLIDDRDQAFSIASKYAMRILNTLEILKTEDNTIPDYEIIEKAIDTLEGKGDY